MSFEVIINHTGKAVGKPDEDDDGHSNYQRYDDEKKPFPTLDAAKAWVKENYGKYKRRPIYHDTTEGGAKRIGWVFHVGKQRDLSHAVSEDNQPWMQEDWVEIREVAVSHPTNWRL